MIILAGESEFQEQIKDHLQMLGYVEDTLLPSFHAKGMFPTAPAASNGSLMDWLIQRPALTLEDFSGQMDKTPTAGNEWRARIAAMNETVGDDWFIHDFRVFWFFQDFMAEAKRVKVIAVRSDDNNYYKAISRFLDKRLPVVPTLEAKKPPTRSQIKRFLEEPIAIAVNDIAALNETAGNVEK